MGVRWVCPDCGSAKVAPKAPRRDDVRRFCLRCSERTGRLVERGAPVLERQRARRKAKHGERKRREVERARDRWVVNGTDVWAEWSALLRLPGIRWELRDVRSITVPNFKLYHGRANPRSTSGHCSYDGTRIHVTIGVRCDRATIVAVVAHELAHALCPAEIDHEAPFWRRLADLLEQRFGPKAFVLPVEGCAGAKQTLVEQHLRKFFRTRG